MASIAASEKSAAPRSVWAGRLLTALFALFMLGASIAPKLLGMPVAAETLAALGWPVRYVPMIGLFELAFLLLYLVPRTSVLGAVLMTALIGGALATHIRVGSPLFSHTLFGIYLALFMWGGLWLRSPALRAIFPIVRERN
jgi:DoxX-like protein